MDNETIIRNFWSVVNHANKAWEENIDCKDYEKEFVQVLKYIKCYQSYKNIVINLLYEMIDDPRKGNLEILSFCMRELQWQEIKNYIEQKVNKSDDIRLNEALVDVTNVFKDDWEDSYMWPYYNN